MICKETGCGQPTVGQSRYCRTHRADSRARFKEMLAEQAAEREQRYQGFEELWEKAHQAGLAAAEATTPTPMVVQQHLSPMDDNSPVVQQWHVPQGACGFAWVTVRPGNSSFAIWAKNNRDARKAYYGGVEIWVHEFGQSVELKEAYAQAFAQVLQDAGIKAYSGSRLD